MTHDQVKNVVKYPTEFKRNYKRFYGRHWIDPQDTHEPISTQQISIFVLGLVAFLWIAAFLI